MNKNRFRVREFSPVWWAAGVVTVSGLWALIVALHGWMAL